MTDFVRALSSPEETFAFGRRLGAVLRGGDFLALCGPLGAGKTHFVKGVGAGLGVPEDEPIVSPTFVLVREYAGNLTLFHIDAYRLGSADELLAIGLEEMTADPGAVVAVEWADRVPAAIPPGACWIELEHVGPAERRVSIRWTPERLAVLTSQR